MFLGPHDLRFDPWLQNKKGKKRKKKMEKRLRQKRQKKKHNKCKSRLSGQTSRLDVEVFTATITFASYRASQRGSNPRVFISSCVPEYSKIKISKCSCDPHRKTTGNTGQQVDLPVNTRTVHYVQRENLLKSPHIPLPWSGMPY